MSLRRRLLLGILTVAIVLVVTNVALASTFEAYQLDRTDEELAATASRSVFGPGGRGSPPGMGGPRGGEEHGAPLTDLFIAVADLQRGTLTRYGSAIDEAQQPPDVDASLLVDHASPDGGPLEPFTSTSADGGTLWRLVALGDTTDGGLLVVGVTLDDVEATLARLRVVQVIGTASVLAALAAVSWWVLRLGVRPVVAMAGTADRIAAGDLSQRVELVDERTEAGRLGSAFNEMLSKIEDAFRQREASEARVRQFAADASHELRTPLTSIRGYAELWQAGGLRDEAELAEAMRRMAEEGKRMGALVEDLLVLARLDQQRASLHAPVRLDLLVADGVRDARAVEPDRPITLESVVVTVPGDERQLRQIVANLLANARAHTPAGTPVEVCLEQVEGAVRLTVADHGPGLPPGAEEKVFERFYRVDGARTRSAGGNGLGLSIVATIAHAHGGRAWATSTPVTGAQFTVELPASPFDGRAPSPPAA